MSLGLRRITFSWYRSVSLPPRGWGPRQRALLLLLLLFIVSSVVLLGMDQRHLWGLQRRSGSRVNR